MRNLSISNVRPTVVSQIGHCKRSKRYLFILPGKFPAFLFISSWLFRHTYCARSYKLAHIGPLLCHLTACSQAQSRTEWNELGRYILSPGLGLYHGAACLRCAPAEEGTMGSKSLRGAADREDCDSHRSQHRLVHFLTALRRLWLITKLKQDFRGYKVWDRSLIGRFQTTTRHTVYNLNLFFVIIMLLNRKRKYCI